MNAEKLNLTNSMKEFEKAKELIPGGVLLSRRPSMFVPGEYPVFIDEGNGGTIKDIDGNEYIDYMCAYGPIIIGYKEPEIDEAVIKQIRDKGFCFTLAQTYQNQLAEKLRELIPCAEMSIFVKTGSEATTSAVRLSRAFTGRIKVMRCGYHGWHDWCTKVRGGIPEKLYEDVFEFEYNNLDSLETLLKEHGKETAAVIVTPYGHELHKPMQDPEPGFLEGVRALTQEHGAVLIFDEIRTNFRISMGGAQKYYGVIPDLAALGKSMGNGYAIGAVSGKREIMSCGAADVAITSTFFPNSLAFIAALKTIEFLEKHNVLQEIWEKGQYLMNGINQAIQKYDVGARLSGIPPMMYITFEKGDDEFIERSQKDIYTQMIRRKVFMHPNHHGYVCYRHTKENLDDTIQAVEASLEYLINR